MTVRATLSPSPLNPDPKAMIITRAGSRIKGHKGQKGKIKYHVMPDLAPVDYFDKKGKRGRKKPSIATVKWLDKPATSNP